MTTKSTWFVLLSFLFSIGCGESQINRIERAQDEEKKKEESKEGKEVEIVEEEKEAPKVESGAWLACKAWKKDEENVGVGCMYANRGAKVVDKEITWKLKLDYGDGTPTDLNDFELQPKESDWHLIFNVLKTSVVESTITVEAESEIKGEKKETSKMSLSTNGLSTSSEAAFFLISVKRDANDKFESINFDWTKPRADQKGYNKVDLYRKPGAGPTSCSDGKKAAILETGASYSESERLIPMKTEGLSDAVSVIKADHGDATTDVTYRLCFYNAEDTLIKEELTGSISLSQ